MLRFGDYEFRPDTGDLRRVSPPPPGTAVRLAPQPAKLLELLLERRGALVERDEIRRALWSDTHVDFDQSLAFCVRQLRAALGDSGAKPTYIETLPRRGFRLVAAVVEPIAEPTDDEGSEPRPASSRLARVGWPIAILLLVTAAVAGAYFVLRGPRVVTRLAIMPFELAASAEPPMDRLRLALVSESLVVDLARDRDAGIEVIGPRTTAKYHGSPFPDLDALANDLAIDYVLNGRYLDAVAGESPPVLIVELIRLEDRAHPWVERFDGDQSPQGIAATVRGRHRAHLARRGPRPVTRLAIMPFELAAGVENLEDRSRLALVSESLVVDLARGSDAGIEVIGPRTTAKYHVSPFPYLDALANNLEIDYVLNGRYLEAAAAASPSVLIVELIRLRTGPTRGSSGSTASDRRKRSRRPFHGVRQAIARPR